MTRWLLGTIGIIAFLPVAALAGRPVESKPPPNIIFILADDLGYGDVGCYGQKLIQTPNIDKLAAEGRRFTQCYAGCTVCAPSRCSLMTGLHTGHCWIRGNALVPLRPQDRTVAEVLKSAGYHTAAIGKWGLGEAGSTGVPNRKGFDEWFGYLNQRHAHNYYPEFLWKNESRFPLTGNVDVKGVSVQRAQYSHDLFTREALAFLDRPPQQPFFLYLAFTIPHSNDEAGENGMEVPSDAPYSDRPWLQPHKNRAAMITRMDADIGGVMKKLKERGMDEQTIVFFASDNGPSFEGGGDPTFFQSSGPFRGVKRDLYEGGIRMPMIVRWPGIIEPGKVSPQVWAFWDFLPTAAELAGVSTPAGLDGISMVPAILIGRQQANHEFLYWEFHERGFHQAARMGDWKYIRYPRKPGPELYDLETDEGETKNVAAMHPKEIARIESCLRSARTTSPNWPVRRN